MGIEENINPQFWLSVYRLDGVNRGQNQTQTNNQEYKIRKKKKGQMESVRTYFLEERLKLKRTLQREQLEGEERRPKMRTLHETHIANKDYLL